MNELPNKDFKAQSEARHKHAATASAARYAELDRLTGQRAAERMKELNSRANN